METLESRLAHLERRVAEAEEGRRRAEWRGRVMAGLALVVVVGTIALGSLPRATAAGPGSTLETRMSALESLLVPFSRSGHEVVITGANLHIVNGLGTTETTNGLGNLIVGYNELRRDAVNDRTGSHNIVVGERNNFTAFGGLVVGNFNAISGAFGSVSGGCDNTASNVCASVSGGKFNTASGFAASVSGGGTNLASGQFASVSGGDASIASGQFASVSGGEFNTASGFAASVSGGNTNTADGNSGAVSGGLGIATPPLTFWGWAAGSEAPTTINGNFTSLP